MILVYPIGIPMMYAMLLYVEWCGSGAERAGGAQPRPMPTTADVWHGP